MNNQQPLPGFSQQSQQAASPPHVCFTGSLSCSGAIPCEGCEMAIRQWVFPYAMHAAGFTGSPEQVQAFFEGLTLGWRNFHTMMVQDPQMAQLIVITNVNGLTPGASMPSGPVGPAQAQAPNGANGPGAPQDSAPPIVGPVTTEQLDSMLAAQERSKKKAQGMTQQMDAEDIAAARTPVVIGNVMKP